MKFKINSGRFWLRFICIGGVLVFCLTLILQGVLRWQFSEKRLKSEIIQLIEPTKRIIQFGDGISVDLFPRPSVTLNNIRISEPDNPHTALTIKRVTFAFAWLDLLNQNPAPNRLMMDEVNANIVRNENGSLSVDDLLDLRHQENSVPSTLKRLQFINSSIDAQDKLTHTNFRLEKLNFLLKNQYSANGSLDAQAHLLTSTQNITLSVRSDINKTKDAFQLNNLIFNANTRMIRYGQTQLDFKAQIDYQPDQHRFIVKKIDSTLTAETPQLNVTGSGENWSVHLNQASLPKINFNATVTRAQNPQTRVTFEGQLQSLQFRDNMIRANNIRLISNIQNKARTLSIESTADLSLNVSSRVFSLDKIQINSRQRLKNTNNLSMLSQSQGKLTGILGQNYTFTAQGMLEQNQLLFNLDYQAGKIDQYQFKLVLDKLNSEPIEPKENEELTPAFFDSEQPFHLDFFDDKKIEGFIDIKDLVTSSIQIQQLNAHVKASSNEIHIDQINASIYQGKLTGQAKLTTSNNTPKLEVDQRVIGVRIQPLLNDLFGYQRLTGKGNGRIVFTATGKNPKEMRRTLSGDISLDLNNGALLGINLVDTFQNSPAQLQAQTEQKIAADPSQKTAFRLLKGSAHIENGIARNKNLILDSELINLKGEGKLDLDKELIDYTMYITASPEINQFKDMNVPLRITGDITMPVYSLNYAAMTKGKTTKEEKQKALKEELLKQINGLIKQ